MRRSSLTHSGDVDTSFCPKISTGALAVAASAHWAEAGEAAVDISSGKHGINVAVLGQIGPLHVQDTTGQHGGRGYFPSLGGIFSGRILVLNRTVT